MVNDHDSRPNPDLLLEQATREEVAARKGKLKIFFGAAPGVGKTYAMLESAHAKKRAGIDVVVGVIETHGRADTAAKLDGLEILPRKLEFDLDAALARKPELILIDELAHTNLKGSRHLKRWQDVEELLNSGIDVYATLNVQHVESLNDVVAQITGIMVRETVPDQVIEMASEMELIDLPVEELIERMRSGKIYVPEQAERALTHFFRPGNLNALRELALRRTADHVDTNVVALRGDKTWPVAERLLLAIGPSPFATNLIRATKRLASQLEAEWLVLYVETSAHATFTADQKQHIHNSLDLAQSLGAEISTIGGESVAQAILEIAKLRNVSRIVVGKSPGSRLVGALLESSGDISIVALHGGGKFDPPTPTNIKLPGRADLLKASALIALATLICLPLRQTIAPTNLIMIYLLAVVAVATRHSRETAIFASLLSVASFDFFCVPPYLTFAVSDVEYLFTFVAMLLVSLVISTLTVRLRSQATSAIEREYRGQSLSRLTRDLVDIHRHYEAAQALFNTTSTAFATKVNVFLPDSNNKLSFRRRQQGGLLPPSQEEGIAQWCFDHRQPAGKSAPTLPGATAQYHPIHARETCYGVFVIEDPPTAPEQKTLLAALIHQTALAMERLTVREQARQSALSAESEQLRNSLLSAVSHDLRTPLTSIAGAASTLLNQHDQLSPEQSHQLLQSISNESSRLNRLVSTLLEITRLDQPGVHLNLDWCSIEEILATLLDQFDPHPITTHIQPDLPLLRAEAQLLATALQNLIENAIKHTPPATPIEIRAQSIGNQLQILVLDEGPGITPGEESNIFNKFYRLNPATSTRGVGLGLAIVKSIVEAHRGQVRASNRPGGGAQFEILLPLSKS